jgi:(p)ppGpp synthase/HD superfamily hydrolase
MSLFQNDNELPTEVQFIHIICGLRVGYENQGKILWALHLALKIHEKQRRYTTGENYICHPIRVTNKVIEILQRHSIVDQDLVTRIVIVSLLHDVIEDNKRYHRRNFARQIERDLGIDGLARDLIMISRLQEDSYGDYLERFREAAWYLWLVKFVDFIDNYQDLHLDANPKRLLKRIEKCTKHILPFLSHAQLYNSLPEDLQYIPVEAFDKLQKSVVCADEQINRDRKKE